VSVENSSKIEILKFYYFLTVSVFVNKLRPSREFFEIIIFAICAYPFYNFGKKVWVRSVIIIGDYPPPPSRYPTFHFM